MKLLIAITLLLITTPALAGQYLYVLKLVPRLHDDSAWTEADNAAIGRHFRHLQQAAAAGTVILGGRTQEPARLHARWPIATSRSSSASWPQMRFS